MAVVRRWRRVQTADGARFVSALEPHEVALLKNMATSIQEMLDDRQAGSPSDPLEEITGIRTGNPKPPEDATLSRLLPGFVKDPQAGQATPERSPTASCAASMSLPSSTPKLLLRNDSWPRCPKVVVN